MNLKSTLQQKWIQLKIDAITRAIHELQDEIKDMREEKKKLQEQIAKLDD